MTTTNNDKSRQQTVAELFQAAGLVTERSSVGRPASRARWRAPSILVALVIALALALATAALALH